MVVLAPPEKLPWVGTLSLLIAVCVYPHVLRRIIHPQRALLLGLMIIPPLFLFGEVDRSILGVGYSSQGGEIALQILLRFMIVMLAVDGLADSIEISSLAGLLERFGLKGLGFSLGVALNVLPTLRQTSVNAWQSLYMRGGLRKQRWRGLGYLIATIITNALRRAEEIALAAEARAYSPEKSHPLPIRRGHFDWLPITLGFPLMMVLLWL